MSPKKFWLLLVITIIIISENAKFSTQKNLHNNFDAWFIVTKKSLKISKR